MAASTTEIRLADAVGVQMTDEVLTVDLSAFVAEMEEVTRSFEVQLPPEVVGTGYTSIAMPQQVRTISRIRLLEKIGRIDDPDLQDVLEGRLMEHFGIAFDTEDL